MNENVAICLQVVSICVLFGLIVENKRVKRERVESVVF